MENRGAYEIKLVPPTEPTPTLRFTPTPTPEFNVTIDKKTNTVTYKDTMRTIIFSYPPTWTISKSQDMISISTPDVNATSVGEFRSRGSLSLSWFSKDAFVPATPSATPQEILESKYAFFRDNATETIIEKYYKYDTVNGNAVLRYKEKPWGTANANVALIYMNGNIFKLTCTYADKYKAEVSDGCEKIITSFAEVIETKTYEDSVIKFSYPSSWKVSSYNNQREIEVTGNKSRIAIQLSGYPFPAKMDVPIDQTEWIKIGPDYTNLNYYTTTVTQEKAAYAFLNRSIRFVNISYDISNKERSLYDIKNILKTIEYKN